MTSREFSEWAAYDQLEPIGEPRADIRNAMLMALWAEAYRDRKKRGDPFGVAEFIPFFWAETAREAETEEPDPEELWQKVRAWALVAGKKRNDGDPE